MHKTTAWLLTTACAVALGGAAYAQGAAAKPAKAAAAEVCPTTNAAKEAMVLAFLHQANQDEVSLARLADQKAQTPEAKSFAQTMMKDHSDLDQRLVALATKNRIELAPRAPADPIHAAVGKANEALAAGLKAMTGPRFDIAYIAPEVIQHEIVLQVIDQGLRFASKPEVKELLEDTRAHLVEHRKLAMQLQDQMQFRPAAGGSMP